MSEQTEIKSESVIPEGPIAWREILNVMPMESKGMDLERFLCYSPTEDRSKHYIEAYKTRHNGEGLALVQTMTKPIKEYDLCRKACSKAFDNLREIRLNAISTHHESHAKSHLFLKLFDMVCLYLKKLSDHWMNPIAEKYFHVTERYITQVKEEYGPIHDVLTASVSFDENEALIDLTKWEKHLLLRAFWDDFQKRWEEFIQIDWVQEYTTLWDLCLRAYRELI
jgi:hypothetical protein